MGHVHGDESTREGGRPNRVAVALPGFDPASQVVVIDPAPVLAGADLMANALATAPGCMSSPLDADCAGVLPLLGLPGPEGAGAQPQRLVAAR